MAAAALHGAEVKTGSAKLEDVTALLNALKLDLKEKNLSAHQRDSMLEQLKVYGRDVDHADPIFTKDGIETLVQYAFGSTSSSTSREALRCLANALLLKQETRQLLVDCGSAPKAAERLNAGSSDDEFLLSRILLLMTYGTNADYRKLVEQNALGKNIIQCLASHAKQYTHAGRHSPTHISPMDSMALTETCKLVFNITHFYPDLASTFSSSIPNLLLILQKTNLSNPPLEQPLSSVINALLNLDFADKSQQDCIRTALFPTSDPNSLVEHIVDILEAVILHYKATKLDQTASPVISLIRKIYEVAPEDVRKRTEFRLLPSDDERSKPLGKSDTLPSRLLRLSTSTGSLALRTSISAMMFELSGQDSTKFVHNVGYGFAAGFLMAQNIPIPENASGGVANLEDGVEVNPITGQRRDRETIVDAGPPMTDEEKEREAERLFVLFERLKRTGVVDVVNPITRAREEGRFEELPDE